MELILTMELRTQHGRCGNMKKAEILKIIEKIENMKTIKNVKIKTEDFEMVIEKAKQIPTQSVAATSGRVRESNAAPGMASEFQVKYARDLIRKIFGNDESAGLDFLAHTLELLLEDVPDIDTWDTTLTVEMVSSIIDTLQPMHGKSKGGD